MNLAQESGLSERPFEGTAKAGLAIITAVKNRAAPLQFSIPTWLSQPSVKQLVIVDWDSNRSLIDELSEFDIPRWPDERCTIVRVSQQPRWNFSKAINLGMRFVKYETVFKVDADVLIIDDIRSKLPEVQQSFVAGNWRHALMPNDQHLHGSVVFSANDFWSIGGYDERFETYGWEDDDFYQRLVAAGLTAKHFERGKLFHLPHSDRKRIASLDIEPYDLKSLIRQNRIVASQRKAWSRLSERAAYSIQSLDRQRNYFVVDQENSSLQLEN